MNCPSDEQLQTYHDRELSSEMFRAIESHLIDCAECAGRLQQLEAMSNFITSAPAPRFSQMSRARLHRKIDDAMDQGLVRLAWALSGLAASILIVGSILLTMSTTSSTAVAATPPWVEAVNPTAVASQNAATPAAQYYLADATTRTEEVP